MNTTKKTNRKVFWLTILLTGASLPGLAQKLEHVASFWGFNGVEFLPGGYVQEYNDDEVTKYRYRNSGFVRLKGRVSGLGHGWPIADADNYDEIDLTARLSRNLRAFLPRQARVKKYYKIELPNARGRLIVLCYTKQLQIEGSNTQDVFITAALDASPRGSRPVYHKLWSKKVATETNYQDFQYHTVSGAGAFFLLYTEGVSGDALEFNLDVFRMKALEQTDGNEPSENPRKE